MDTFKCSLKFILLGFPINKLQRKRVYLPWKMHKKSQKSLILIKTENANKI